MRKSGLSPTPTLRRGVMMGLALALWATCAVAATPDAVRLYESGLKHYGQGNTTQALKDFRQATQRNPRYADAYYNLGSIYYQVGKYPEAKEAFQKVLSLNPQDPQCQYGLALTEEKLANPTEALRLYRLIPATDRKYAMAQKKIALLSAQSSSVEKSPVKAEPTAKTPAAASTPRTPTRFVKGLFGPTGMALGLDNALYVANYSKNLIYKIRPNGEKAVFAQGAGLNGPIGLVVNPWNGDLYVANYLENTIVAINPQGKVSVLASGLSKPYNLFLDSKNNTLYVSEQESNAVSKIELNP